MNSLLQEISLLVEDFGSAPKLEEMPKRTLADKGIAGPTAAHVIEDVHTPLNLAYLTFTTGTSAFQNIVGVTYAELPARIRASVRILERAGLKCGDKLLVTYPPLVNVFSGQALKDFGLKWSFLVRSSRDAFLAALYKERPAAVVGESAFLRAALTDAKNMGVAEDLPKGVKLLTAGTPLDLELLPVAQELLQAEVHDLYGCQEIGWLAMDGIPVRDDIELTPAAIRGGQQYYELIAGGLPMGDSFPCSESGHVCNKAGKIITYRRERTYPEYEVIVKATTLASAVTLNRVARSILRIKGRIVKVSSEVQVNAEQTILELRGDPISGIEIPSVTITGPVQTEFFDKTQLKRHDLVYPSSIGRARLKQVFLNELTGEKAFLAADIFRADSVIPGIVRRAEVLSADVIPLGFVHPQLCEGRRLRLTAELEVGEAVKLKRPYELAAAEFKVSTNCLAAAQAACSYAAERRLKLGILGSAGLEIATGLPFTNSESDLDLLITGLSLQQLQEVYTELQAIGKKFQVDIDLETELINGYGIKAAELFQPTQTVLGKSLQDVQILKKKTVVEILSQEA